MIANHTAPYRTAPSGCTPRAKKSFVTFPLWRGSDGLASSVVRLAALLVLVGILLFACRNSSALFFFYYVCLAGNAGRKGAVLFCMARTEKVEGGNSTCFSPARVQSCTATTHGQNG